MKRRGLMFRIALALVAITCLGMAATAKLFLWPASSVPRHADAVVVLSGDHGERLARALRLMEAGVAPTLVLDGEPDFQQVRDLCLGGQTYEVVCLRPRPDSTRAEARAAARLASDRGWRHIVVVTTTAHVSRAGLLFRRCVEGSVDMVKAHRRPHVRLVVHEWLGLVHALTLAREC